MGSSDEVEIFKEKGKKGKRVLEGNYGEVKRQKRDNVATCGKKVRKSREKKFTPITILGYGWVSAQINLYLTHFQTHDSI